LKRLPAAFLAAPTCLAEVITKAEALAKAGARCLLTFGLLLYKTFCFMLQEKRKPSAVSFQLSAKITP
jgi:hypothetical protein